MIMMMMIIILLLFLKLEMILIKSMLYIVTGCVLTCSPYLIK